MTESCRIIVVFCVCMSVLFVNACRKKPDNTESKEYMTGYLTHDVPKYLYKGRTYTFTVSGITKPEEGLSYRWVATGFSPDTCLTPSYTFTTPKKKGSYTISINISCEDYYDKNDYVFVAVIDSVFSECLTGIVRGTDSIIDPRDGAKYYTRQYGKLEWFVQNLNWAGAGFPYSKVEALGAPFGRLYSWNEATLGIAANGLGAGPQGACPPGWSVPTNEDWAHLATIVNDSIPLPFLDNWDNIADPLCAYAKLNDTYVWPYSPRNTKSNSAAWNGLPGGNSSNNGNNFSNYGNYGFWLSSSEANASNGYYRYINYDINKCSYHHTDKSSFGASVRCVRLVHVE